MLKKFKTKAIESEIWHNSNNIYIIPTVNLSYFKKFNFIEDNNVYIGNRLDICIHIFGLVILICWWWSIKEKYNKFY